MFRTNRPVDDGDYFDTPLVAATSFLIQLVKSRTKVTFVPILTFINHVLRSNPDAPQKYGALNMTVALSPFIMRHPDFKDGMEQFLVQHALPCFGAPEPYLRAVACEVLCAVEKVGVKWSNEQVRGTVHHTSRTIDPLCRTSSPTSPPLPPQFRTMSYPLRSTLSWP